MTARRRWAFIGAGITAVIVGYCVWLVVTDAPAYRFLVRLYVDKYFLKQTLRRWGGLAPVIFIVLQALQVIIAPIPGEITGILGGYLFGEWLGLVYSTLGLTLGSGFSRWSRLSAASREPGSCPLRAPIRQPETTSRLFS